MEFLQPIRKYYYLIGVLSIIILYRVSTADENIYIPIPNVFIRSFESLSNLVLVEKHIYELLKNYSHSSNDGFNELTSYLEDYEDSSGRLIFDEHDQNNVKTVIAGHPLLSSRMLYRYTVDIMNIQTVLSLKNILELTDVLQELLDTLRFSTGLPYITDTHDMWLAILRVVHVYELDISKFATGHILESETGYGLKAKHCFEISKRAITERYFSQAIEWSEFIIRLITTQNDKTVDLKRVQEFLVKSMAEHDKEWDLVPAYENKFFTYKLSQVFHPQYRQSRRNYLYSIWKGKREPNFNEINFWALCSGEDLRTEEKKSQLFCWYDFKSNPAWYINPLKIEQLSKSPDLRQIYEVIGNKIIQKIIQLAQPSLTKSNVSTIDGPPEESYYRTSSNTWINDSDIKNGIPSLSRRIELITNLEVIHEDSSEMIQTVRYNFGGHYEVHMDTSYFTNFGWNNKYGRRIATFLIYLSDVEKGGYTAFAQAGIAARPVKGSAVFWYNLKRNGDIDETTYHGACPVILGNKWVANKWVRSYRQFLKRPCTLNSSE